MNAWIGGSSTNALAFGLPGVTQSTAAVLLAQRPDVENGFFKSYVIDKVYDSSDGVESLVTGIRAMSAYNLDGMVYGVFES